MWMSFDVWEINSWDILTLPCRLADLMSIERHRLSIDECRRGLECLCEQIGCIVLGGDLGDMDDAPFLHDPNVSVSELDMLHPSGETMSIGNVDSCLVVHFHLDGSSIAKFFCNVGKPDDCQGMFIYIL